jgi:hypothetical protein
MSIIAYLQSREMTETIKAFVNEADIPENIRNNMQLHCFMAKKEFGKALGIVQKVMDDKKDDDMLQSSFDDLIYVISKYLVIHLHETRQEGSQDILELVLWPLIEKAQDLGGMRYQWFINGMGTTFNQKILNYYKT